MKHPRPPQLTVLKRLLLLWLLVAIAGSLGAVELVHDPDKASAPIPTKARAIGDPLAAIEPADAIAEIYQRFSDISRASGYDIRFELGTPETFRPNQFDKLIWLDLFTTPGGWTLETTPHERLGAVPSENLISFVSEWQDADDTSWNAQDFLKSTTLLRADDAIGQLEDWGEQRVTGLDGLSTFDVTVHHVKRSRTYRAMVLWKALGPDTLLFTLTDHVTPEVAQAFHEERAVVTKDELLSPPRDAATIPQKLNCLPYNNQDLFGPYLTTNNIALDHSSGGHSASLRVRRSCTAVGCFGYCNPYSAGRACNETGSVSFGFWHKRSNKVAVDSKTGYGTSPSECGYAWGCAVKKCLLGICSGASFSVSGAGKSIKVNASGSVLSDMSLNFGAPCPPIEVQTDDCFGPVDDVVVLSLDDGTVKSALPSADFTLKRVEPSTVVHHGEPLSFLMGEWALLRHGGTGKAHEVEALDTSNPGFAQAKGLELENALANGAFDAAGKATGEDQLLLVVGLPLHETNDRKIPMPTLKVDSGRLPAGTEARKVLVRADFGEDHSLQALEIIHDTLGGVPYDLALRIEDALRLESASDEEHRVVTFALLSIDDTIELEAVIPYLPKCCFF
ncbi:MAG: hypothetical protein AAGC60_07730 [Acidobacteriota bacterium]